MARLGNARFVLLGSLMIDIQLIIKNAVVEALSEFFTDKNMPKVFAKSHEKPLDAFLSVKQFCEKHKFISVGGLRDLIFHREYNGFSIVISKVGRKILINEKAALDWFKDPPPESKKTSYQSPDKKTIYKYKKQL